MLIFLTIKKTIIVSCGFSGRSRPVGCEQVVSKSTIPPHYQNGSIWSQLGHAPRFRPVDRPQIHRTYLNGKKIKTAASSAARSDSFKPQAAPYRSLQLFASAYRKLRSLVLSNSYSLGESLSGALYGCFRPTTRRFDSSILQTAFF